MDLMKDIFKKELRTRIAAWEGKKTDDFQYEPERAELKAQMKDWLAEKLGVDDEKKLLIAFPCSNTCTKFFFINIFHQVHYVIPLFYRFHIQNAWHFKCLSIYISILI